MAAICRPILPTYKNLGAKTEFQTDPETWLDKMGEHSNVLGILAKTGLNAANYGLNRNRIKTSANSLRESVRNSSKVAQERVEPTIHAMAREVGAVEDIPAEVLAAEKNRIAGMQNKYKGSDPILRAITALSVEGEKSKLSQALGQSRATQLLSERNRVSSERGQNQLGAIDAMNKRSAAKSAEDARIRGVRGQEIATLADITANESRAKGELNTSALNQMVGTIDSASAYNLKKELKESEYKLQSIDNTLAGIDALPFEQRLARGEEKSQLLEQKNAILNEGIPTYSNVLGYGVKWGKTSSKLSPKP